ncbi:MAG: Dabb family protein [Chloroflexi bacterium]|nr:Dabb family protein [Chloroflexota bacterium]
MIKHIVVWKLKDSAEGASKKENALILKSKLEGLKRSIKEVKHLEVGFPMSDSVDTWDVALYSEFENVEDLDVYRKHPEHMKVVELLNKIQLERRLVDYQV